MQWNKNNLPKQLFINNEVSHIPTASCGRDFASEC